MESDAYAEYFNLQIIKSVDFNFMFIDQVVRGEDAVSRCPFWDGLVCCVERVKHVSDTGTISLWYSQERVRRGGFASSRSHYPLGNPTLSGDLIMLWLNFIIKKSPLHFTNSTRGYILLYRSLERPNAHISSPALKYIFNFTLLLDCPLPFMTCLFCQSIHLSNHPPIAPISHTKILPSVKRH